jgi:O-antigen/teichoic acid export membrane protein
VIRNFAYSLVSTATAGLLLALMIIAERYLGTVEFGKFMFALLLGGVFETLMDFGLHQVTVRAIARDPASAPSLLRHTLAIKLLWASGALALLAIATNLLRPEPDVRMACYLIGGASIFRSYMLTVRGVLQGLERFGWESFVVIADRVLLLSLGSYALASGGGLRGLTIAFVVARGIALLVAGVITQVRLGGVGLSYDRGVWRDLHATALPLGFFLIVLNLYQYADGVMLGYFRTDAETGLYGGAFKVYEGLTYGAMAISAVLTPRLSALFVSDRRRHRRLSIGGIGGSAALGALVGAGGLLFAMPLLTLPFGSDFAAGAAPPFRILCTGLPIVFGIWILHATAISVDREKLLLRTGLIGLVVNVGLNLYVIPRFGVNGAAGATVAGELVSLAVLLLGLRASLSSEGAWSTTSPRGSSSPR